MGVLEEARVGRVGESRMIRYSGESRLASHVVVRKERLLPVRGDVVVTIDDRVDAADVVARAPGVGRLHVLEAASILGVKPQDLRRHTRKKIGEPAQSGEVLAVRPLVAKAFPRTVRAPADGRIVFAVGGWFLFEENVAPIELRAEISGRVISVMPGRGVVIETMGAMLQAAWNSGTRASGVLRLVAQSPDAIMEASSLDVACHGSILIGGAGATEGALNEAERLNARGMILGGLSSTLVPLAQRLSFPIVTTEGLGQVPMNRMAFDLLVGSQGREASLEPGNMNPWSPARPEIIIPEPTPIGTATEMPPLEPLALGAMLRVIRQPNMGMLGTLVESPEYLIRYENGLRLPSLRVQGDRVAEVVTVPLVNVEQMR